MKIENIAIVLIVLIASSVMAMAANENPGVPSNPDVIGPGPRIEVENETVVFIKFGEGDYWNISLSKGDWNQSFNGTIDIDDMHGKIFSVKFVVDETQNPGYIIDLREGDNPSSDTGYYDAEIYVSREGEEIVSKEDVIYIPEAEVH